MSSKNQMIENIRNDFLTIADNNCFKFHPKDVERVQNNDWAIKRFVLAHKSAAEALKALVRAMEWRNTFGVNDFTENYFPEEIYRIGEFSLQGRDKEDRSLIWFRFDRHHKSQELGLLLRQYMVYNMEKVDRLTKNGGWAMIIDCTGSGLSNTDIEFFKFNTEVFYHYYPNGLKYTCIVDLPYIMNAAAKLVMSFLNEDMRRSLKFLNKSQLVNYVDSDYLPVHLNGSYDKDWVVIPACAKPLELSSQLTLSADQIKKIRQTFKAWLK